MHESFQYEVTQGSGRILRGDYHPARNSEAEASIVIVHGFKGFKDWGMFPYAADRLAETFDVVRINLTRNGVGGSLTDFDELEKFGQQTITGDLEDIQSVISLIKRGTLPLKGRHPMAGRVILLGHSRGGGEAIVHGLDHPDTITGIVSWNGTVQFESMFGEAALQRMRDEGVTYIANARTNQQMPLERIIADDLEEHAEQFNIDSRISKLKVPLALIQGDNDHKRLIEGSARIVKANPLISWVRIKDGDHTFNAKHPFTTTTPPLEEAVNATIRAIRAQML
ncbi:alpha/beta hydrolase [Paenibacillaceae bacterium]|nr:alpha/beta hydrolase [Paenibacillaceae bacterium]